MEFSKKIREKWNFIKKFAEAWRFFWNVGAICHIVTLYGWWLWRDGIKLSRSLISSVEVGHSRGYSRRVYGVRRCESLAISADERAWFIARSWVTATLSGPRAHLDSFSPPPPLPRSVDAISAPILELAVLPESRYSTVNLWLTEVELNFAGVGAQQTHYTAIYARTLLWCYSNSDLIFEGWINNNIANNIYFDLKSSTRAA